MISKRIFSLFLAVICIFVVTAFSACSGDGTDNNDNSGVANDETEYEEDIYGFVRPTKAWITDCLVLPTLPSTKRELFGTMGESGLLSEWAYKNDGAINDDGTGYIVYMMYGKSTNSLVPDSISTRLNITLITEDNVLYNGDCVELGALPGPDFHEENICIDLTKSEEERITLLKYKSVGVSYLAIPFKLKAEGVLTVDLSIKPYNIGSSFYTYLDTPAFGDSFGNQRDANIILNNFTVKYLTQEQYNLGEFNESDLANQPPVLDDIGYAVVDFEISAAYSNDGKRKINLLSFMEGRGLLDITIESAQTSAVKEIDTPRGTTIYASFTAPSEPNEPKKIRAVLRLMPLSVGNINVSFAITSDNTTTVNNQIIRELFTFTESDFVYASDLVYKMNSDGKSYTIQKVGDNCNADLIIPECLADGYPITAIANNAFQNNTVLKSVIIPDTVTEIGSRAFYGCSALTTLTIRGNAVIKNEAFLDTAISTLHLGNTVSIGNGAFRNCPLTTLTIPKSVKTIDSRAFFKCSLLEEVEFFCSATVAADAFKSDYYTLRIKSIRINSLKDWCESDFAESIITSKATSIYLGGVLLENVVIPDGTTSIGANAFSNYSYIKTVTIPDSVTRIGTKVFSNTSILTSVTIGGGACGLDFTSFYNCPALEEINVSDSNFYYKSTDGILYTKDGETIIKYPSAKGDTRFDIPEGVKKILTYAFYDCKNLTEVKFADTVELIGAYSFYGCESITELIIDGSVTLIEEYAFNSSYGITYVYFGDSVVKINTKAFGYCKSITAVRLGESIKEISYASFSECPKLAEITNDSSLALSPGSYDHGSVALNATTINSQSAVVGNRYKDGFIFTVTNGVNVIKKYEGSESTVVVPDLFDGEEYTVYDDAFRNNTTITSIAFPEGLTSLGRYAFSGCTSLTEVYLPDSLLSMGNNAFDGCVALTHITFPSSISILSNVFYKCDALPVLENGVYYINDFVVGYESGLTDAILRDGTVMILTSAFNGCKTLTSISIPESVREIGSHAFDGCKKLISVTLPPSLKVIETSLFYECISLTEVIIPNTVTDIENYAFRGCSSITSISIPASVNSIGYSTFEGCVNLENVFIGDISAWCTVTFRNELSNPLYYANHLYLGEDELTDIVIPEGTDKIGDYAFVKFKGIISIALPGSIKTIGDSAFSDCSGLQTVSISEGLVRIGNSAFRNCSVLTSISLPDSLTSIGKSAFYKCTGVLQKNGLYNLLGNWIVGFDFESASLNSYYNHIIDDGIVGIADYAFSGKENLSSLTLPSSFKYIGEGAFIRCIYLKTVTLPDSITVIPDYAFSECKILEKINFSKSVTHIGSYAFSKCYKLELSELPKSVNFIGDNAFEYCLSITSFTLHEVTSLGAEVFGNCSSLVTFEFLGTRSAIPTDFFWECIALTSVVFPKGLQKIGSYMFCGCTALTEIVIPEGVTEIQDFAFSDCTNLVSISLPKTLTYIGVGTFSGCKSLESIIIPEGVLKIGSNPFYGCSELKSIYCAADVVAWLSVELDGLTYNTPTNTKVYNYTKNEPLIKDYYYWTFDENGDVLSFEKVKV